MRESKLVMAGLRLLMVLISYLSSSSQKDLNLC